MGKAGAAWEEARPIYTEAGDRGGASRVAVAGLLVEEGRFAEAEQVIRDLAPDFRAQKEPLAEASAEGVQARSLLAQGKLADAKTVSHWGASLARRGNSRGLRLSLAITAARIQAALGQTLEASRTLEATLAEATRGGFFKYQLEARLALGEIEMKSGKPTTGRARLDALEKVSRAKGFERIAHKAEEMSGKR
jgi:ATP/maltotriose-dependent transcriptional regulator MalT